MNPHWTEKLFIEHGDLSLEVIRRVDQRTLPEVEMLEKLFSKMGVQPGDSVLDLCCGFGRHALRLAEKGFIVTGVDLSSTAINYGKGLAESLRVRDRIEFLVGDARNVLKLLKSKQGSFKAMISMWSSIGYYDDATDASILRQVNQLASPHGVLIIETGNRDFFVKHLQPVDIDELEDCELHQHRKLNLETSRMESTWKFYKKEGEELKHLASIPLDHRVYSLHELINLCKATGWTYVNSYGTLDLQPVTPDNNRILIIGKKE